jgi:hypothetical protein
VEESGDGRWWGKNRQTSPKPARENLLEYPVAEIIERLGSRAYIYTRFQSTCVVHF